MRASRTAVTVAYLRALGATADEPSERNPDVLAASFLGRSSRLADLPWARRQLLRAVDRMAPGYYAYEIARTRHLDRILCDSVGDGLEQLLIIGSGYDSRPYRFGRELNATRVFEVDRHPLLRSKQRTAATLGLDTSRIAYVPLDLQGGGGFLSMLEEHGYDRTLRTLILCSGVLMYLDRVAVDGVLALAGSAAPGSAICFDYVYAGALDEPVMYFGASQMVRNVSWAREPYRFSADPSTLSGLLARRGLRLVSDVTAAQLEHMYLVPSRPTLRSQKICGYLGIAHATVQSEPPSLESRAPEGCRPALSGWRRSGAE